MEQTLDRKTNFFQPIPHCVITNNSFPRPIFIQIPLLCERKGVYVRTKCSSAYANEPRLFMQILLGHVAFNIHDYHRKHNLK